MENFCKICRQKNKRKHVICLACESFYYRRMAEGKQLVCSGENCLTEADFESKAVSTWNGTKWRFLCPKCRFSRIHQLFDERKRIREVKLKVRKTRNSTGNSSPIHRQLQASSSTVVPVSQPVEVQVQISIRQPIQMEAGNLEQSLAIHVNAANMVHLELTNGATQLQPAPKEFHPFVYAVVMQFDNMSKAVLKYFRNLPGFQNMSVRDRCILFPMSTFKISLASTANHKENPMTCGVNEEHMAMMQAYFPEAQEAAVDSVHLWNILQKWNPTTIEFSLLLSMSFFYDDQVLINRLEQPEKVKEMFKESLKIFEICQRQLHGPLGDLYIENRIKTALEMVDLLAQLAKRRRALFSKAASRIPNVRKMSRIFDEVIQPIPTIE